MRNSGNLHKIHLGKWDPMRILIVEDDAKMAVVLRDALEKKSHRIVLASTGSEGFEIARDYEFESIILDAMLPGTDGYTVARSLRDLHVSTPILMLTARDATRDVVRGLDSGVDDYNTLDAFMKQLRSKIDGGFANKLIHTVRGFGYRLTSDECL
jgi:DNA-binding response OmpR family regulator